MSNENLPVTLDVSGAVETRPADLLGSDPGARLETAKKIADLLAPVVRDRGLASKIQGREYVRFEGWTLLGSLLGVFPVTEWVHEIQGGFEARVVARTLGGQIVGAAHARCTRDERNWHDRDDFALASMAQTRAGAKALRMPLGFVVQLAGYEATPAEEMPYEEPAPARQPDRAFARGAGPGAPKPAPLANEKQRKLLWVRAKKRGDELGLGDDDVAAALKRVCADLGFASRTEITGAAVDSILRAIEGWTLASFGEPEPRPGIAGKAPAGAAPTSSAPATKEQLDELAAVAHAHAVDLFEAQAMAEKPCVYATPADLAFGLKLAAIAAHGLKGKTIPGTTVPLLAGYIGARTLDDAGKLVTADAGAS